jgi:E3 ubiquitin-protein ligase RNF34
MQRMGTQALLNLPMKKLKFYLTAYQLPTRGALEKQDLVRIIMSSHPVSNASEMHYRKMKALAPKPSRQDPSSQSDNGSSFTGFVNGLMDGIGDIFRDDEEPSRRQDESRRRQQQQQYAPPHHPPPQAPRPPQSHYTPPVNIFQPNNSNTPPQYRPPPAQNGNRPSTQTAPPRQQPQPQPQPRPQQQQSQQQQRSAENNTPPRPPQSTSPVEFEPPSLDTIIQAKIDPSTLSVRTLKGILRANFVEHSKVLEKSELVTRVARLLEDRRKEMQRNDDRGLEDEGLCRICCDASQNCVFLVSFS